MASMYWLLGGVVFQPNGQYVLVIGRGDPTTQWPLILAIEQESPPACIGN
jgi:hypothetical protein